MNWILGLLFVLVIIFLINNFSKKRKLKKLKKKLINNWGKPKNEKHQNFHSISQYFDNNGYKKQAYHLISEKCKVDLDIDEVFSFIDRTSSKIGQQYLYFKLRTIGSIQNLLKFDRLTKLFEGNENLSINCQIQLSQLNSNETHYLEWLINGKQIDKPKYLWAIKLLGVISLIATVLAFLYPIAVLVLIPIFIINLIIHYKNKENITYYLNGVVQLLKSLAVSKNLAKFPEIKSYYNNFSFIKKIDSIKLKTSFIGFEKRLENEFVALFWLLIELIKIQFNIEYIVFFSFINSIKKERESIEKMYVFIGEIDSAISITSLKSGKDQICVPIFTKKEQITIKEISHPLIGNCITNDLNLINSSMLLTGSNMSGKTTFIRSVAINSVLAQTLNICFAKKYIAPFFKIYSSIRIADDLLEGTSYYLEEVLTIKELVDASEKEEPCLFILDEIFKGTNTIERISGGKAVLSYLNQGNNSVFVSTHDIELTDLLIKEDYNLYHFCEHIENDKLIFDYKLKTGKLKTRNAIKILEMNKFPSELIADAIKTEEKNFT